MFELLPAVPAIFPAIFTGEAGAAGCAAKAGSVGKTADALADAGRIVSHVDDIGRIAGRVDDAARGVDALAERRDAAAIASANVYSFVTNHIFHRAASSGIVPA